MRTRQYLLFLGLLVFFLLVFNLPQFIVRSIRGGAREGTAPYQDIALSLTHRFSRLAGAIRNPDALRAENERLAEEVARLESALQRARSFEKENAELRAMLAFSRRSALQLVACEIIARGDVSGWWQSLRLNKGSSDGIATNQAVVTRQGLVGKTVEVSSHTCDVLLITDPRCRVACRLARTQAFGILRGGGVSPGGTPEIEILAVPEPCRMDYVSKNALIVEGDEVVTAGMGGVFPPDLPVGNVKKVSTDRSGLYQRADVLPAVELGRLERVFVAVEEPLIGKLSR